MNKTLLSLTLAGALCLSGCNELPTFPSESTVPPTTTSAVPAAATVATTAATTESVYRMTATTAATLPTTTVTENGEVYHDCTLTEAQRAFLSRCCFVGDSICSGLSLYQILPSKNVVAQGCIAARNIFDYTFLWGGNRLDVVSAVASREPEYVVFWMGMNDVNLIPPAQHAANYAHLLLEIETACPDAQLIVLSTSPVLADSTFTPNEKIDTLNRAVEEMIASRTDKSWRYVDITGELKNDRNGLKSKYSSGDGIHFSQTAYTAMLYAFCQGMEAEIAP